MSTEFRPLLASLLAAPAARHVVVLGIDGLGHRHALAHWPQARTLRLTTVLPTTSSAGWLSSLTGRTVAEHGVPGVVFTDPGAAAPGRCAGRPPLIDVMRYAGPGLTPVTGNIFDDARGAGLRPLAVLGDLEAYPGAWRDALVRGARPVTGHRFYTRGDGPYRPPSARLTAERLRGAVSRTLAAYGGAGPCLLWCYVELDRHVHHHGYDDHVSEVLTCIGEMAADFAAAGTTVVAHSDHGLTATRHDPALAALLDGLGREHGFAMGGAGRVRWLYPASRGPVPLARLAAVLRRELPADIAVTPTDELLPAGSLARARAGELSLVAGGERFLTDPHYTHDHGSASPAELHTPLSTWGFEGRMR
ncbi:alkaline phosphatase family protein [Streptomyces sp. NPDC096339]|uniref:alkaline phosphatase family protein n=1 Tax=Streptomyces sp. NPDC096339 TaxID=3366086 RepID=UPI0037F3FB3B